MLQKKLAEVDERLRTATGEDLYRTQGRAQQLDELIREAVTADQVIKRSEQSGSARVWKQP